MENVSTHLFKYLHFCELSNDIYRLEYDHFTAIQIESSSFAHKDKPLNNLVVMLPQCCVIMREIWTLHYKIWFYLYVLNYISIWLKALALCDIHGLFKDEIGISNLPHFMRLATNKDRKSRFHGYLNFS